MDSEESSQANCLTLINTMISDLLESVHFEEGEEIKAIS